MEEFTSSRGIRLDVQCEAAGLAIIADPGQIEQVLINLVRNASEALIGRSAPSIHLRCSSDERGRVVVQVIDNGAGIDPVNLDNIFVPFFTTKRGGTGVGLSISRQIIQANKGFISARSGESGGSVFTLLFAAAPG
jgi:signal transduction histidine kinase